MYTVYMYTYMYMYVYASIVHVHCVFVHILTATLLIPQAVIESILEAVRELKDQPDCVLLQEEMEMKQRELMDFIVDMEQYSQEKSTQLAELDDSFEELKRVCPEKAELLQEGAETVGKLRKAYEDVAGKVGVVTM